MTFAPKLDILPAPQRALWSELATIPRRHVLYGGTALALRLGHRESIDFDFFSHDDLDPNELDALRWLRGATTLQESPNTRTVHLRRTTRNIAPRPNSIIGAPELPDVLQPPPPLSPGQHTPAHRRCRGTGTGVRSAWAGWYACTSSSHPLTATVGDQHNRSL